MPQAPLVSGSKIVNGRTGSPGTLGFVGVGPGNEHVLVSCYHVLGRTRGATEPPSDGEPIWQPGSELTSEMIALTRLAMMNARFDVAAAPLLPGVPVAPEIRTLGPIRGVADAVEGMRVLKFGAETGLTAGVISYAGETLIEIAPDPDAAEEYVLTEHGDSGALWVSPGGEVIAMHFQGRDGNRAYARPLPFVLATLGLSLLTN
ncbi:MAG: hypothetical protein WEA80_04825 [Gemmatimonadaceae bacterium]